MVGQIHALAFFLQCFYLYGSVLDESKYMFQYFRHVSKMDSAQYDKDASIYLR